MGYTAQDGSSVIIGNAAAHNLLGHCFTASMGLFGSAGGTNQYGLSVFNPADSGVNILIYSIQITNASGGMAAFSKKVTADPAFNTPITPANDKAGGAASAIASTVTYNNADLTPSGTVELVATAVGATTEMLTNGATILLPRGSAHGLVVYLETYGSTYNQTLCRYIEYA